MSDLKREDHKLQRQATTGNGGDPAGDNYGDPVLDGLVERTKLDISAPLAVEVVIALAHLRDIDRQKFVNLREKLRNAGCPMGGLADLMREVENSQARSGRGRPNGARQDDGKVNGSDSAGVAPTLGQIMKTIHFERPLTESDVADVFVTNACDQVRFDHNRGAWYRWTGTYWKEDDTKLVFEAIRRLN